MKRVIRTRRAGTVYIGISIFLGVVAVNSSNNLLYLVTAVLLGYMLASGLAGRSNIRNAQVSVSFAEEIYAQIPCVLTVRIANKSRFVPLFLIDATLEEERGRVFFPVVQPRQSMSRTFFTTFPSRGRHPVGEIELSSVYPFNFFVRYWPVESTATATVFPYPLPGGEENLFARPGGEEEAEIADQARARSLAEADMVGVRPYAEGDSMKRIHWKS
ncbi:MAG: hypothetical protein LBO68_04230, partial [Synergistaceae bacterium]|nr:hypothetical protein [Synergistaceae bacterium]